MQVVYDMKRNVLLFGDWNTSKKGRRFVTSNEYDTKLIDKKSGYLYGEIEDGVLPMTAGVGEIARAAFGPKYRGKRKLAYREMYWGESKLAFRQTTGHLIKKAIGKQPYRFMVFGRAR